MADVERFRKSGAARLQIVVSNDGLVQRSDTSGGRLPPSRAGDGWYHQEAVEQERAARERTSR